MVSQVIGTCPSAPGAFPNELPTPTADGRSPTAKQLAPAARRALSIQALARSEPIAGLARLHGVSRKFVYQQASKASDALDEAFADLATRRELFDFIVAELREREALCAHRIGPIRRMLEGQRDNLLGFAGVLDRRFGDLARQFGIPTEMVHGVCELQGMDRNRPAYWQREARLRQTLRHRFHGVQEAVRRIMAETPRASSLVENLNPPSADLRNYFFLRRQIGNGYLDLLRFFLNHHRFPRSDRAERVGKSPAELLNGRPHPHWLELLGHQRFAQN